jgi:hypothetical protein
MSLRQFVFRVFGGRYLEVLAKPGSVMTTIFGLPAHALLVHGVVVLAPLTAALLVLCALWPAARQRLVWLVLAFAVAVVVLTPLTVSAGEWLYGREEQHSPILELHQERGEWMIYFAAGLLVVAIVVAVQHWLETRKPAKRTVLNVGVAILAVAVSAWAVVGVVSIGHSGTEAKWGTVAE